ncbi:MAG: hypothetical protein V3R64_09885 [Sphingomonadales bacterium]
MHKFNLNNGTRGLLFSAVVALGFSVGFLGENPAHAKLTPELQTVVNQILKAGGDDLITSLSALAQNNSDMAADILSAGCLGGADCLALSTAISKFTDDKTDTALQAFAQDYVKDKPKLGGFRVGLGLGGLLGGGGSTSENSNQTSGS